MPEDVCGFTKKQRGWILDRDDHRCQFRYKGKDGKWRRCTNTKHLDVHHIIPRGWAAAHYSKEFAVNGPHNGITLCREHHRGYGVDGFATSIFILHPDVEVARLANRDGDKQAFARMFEHRRKLVQRGVPYWNTRWDSGFIAIVHKETLRYNRKHPDRPYPDNKNRGRTGRVKDKESKKHKKDKAKKGKKK